MASSSVAKLEVDLEVKSPADKFWEIVRDSTTSFPKLFPDDYKSIEVLEGDGNSVGSIRILKYPEGISFVTFTKERIDVVDEEKKLLTYSVLDGELVKFYKHFKGSLQISPKADGGSLVKWSCEFEKTSEDVPDPTFVHDFALKTLKDLDDYLLKA